VIENQDTDAIRLVVRAIVPLDVPLLVDSAAFNATCPISLSRGPGRLLLPACPDGIMEPFKAPDGFHVTERFWGQGTKSSNEGGQGLVEAVGIELVPTHASLGFPTEELSKAYARGLEDVETEMVDWVRRFQGWGEVLARQSLSPLEPLPTLVSLPSDGVITWVIADERMSWPYSSQRTIKITLAGPLGPLSERVADTSTLSRMAALADDPEAVAPAAVVLIASARRAAQRGQWRLALMELGTALEALLTAQLTLAPGSYMTLGPLTKAALKAGVALPQDVLARFVKPRNAAVHDGLIPSAAVVVDGLAMLDRLCDVAHPTYRCDPNLHVAHRPHRHDLTIMKPPNSA